MGTRIPEGRTERLQTENPRNPISPSGAAGKMPVPGNNSSVKTGLAPKTVFPNRENSNVESKPPLLNSVQQKANPENLLEAPGKNTLLAREAFKHVAHTLGLPSDNLSVTLIALLRFFSLSPDAALLKTLRREILSSRSSSPGTVKEKAALEAKSLAELIAFDKGVKLGEEAMKRYVQYLAPDFSGEESDAQDDGEESSPDDNGKPFRGEIPDAGELRARAEEQTQKEGFLDILNAIPGKSGKKWTVFPFNIIVKGTEFKVFLRLLKGEPLSLGASEYIIADIIGPKRKWRWFLGKSKGKIRSDIQVFPGLSERALKSLQKDAERFFKKGAAQNATGGFDGFDEIRFRNGEEAPSWMEDLYNESLPFINEEV